MAIDVDQRAVYNSLATTQPAQVSSPEARSLLLTETGDSPFVNIATTVKEAVVFITAETEVDVSERSFGEGFDDLFQNLDPAIPSQGSGFLIDPRGYILTNNHVVKDAGDLSVTLNGTEHYAAHVIGRDAKTDLAVIKIDAASPFPHLVFGDSDHIRVGDWVIAVGNPFGLDRTVTVGVISATGRTNLDFMGGGPLYQDFIQTDASINLGNSGGPLVNLKGEVIGINTAVNTAAQGIGFAIPANLAKHIVNELITRGKVTRGFLGVLPRPVTTNMAETEGLFTTNGVYIGQVETASPADKGGIEMGDIILEFDNQPVTTVSQFRFLVADTPVGKDVPIVVWRQGKRKTLRVTLGEMPDDPKIIAPPVIQGDILGLVLQDLTSRDGVVVLRVVPDSPADHAGITHGDILKRMDGNPVANLHDYQQIIDGLPANKTALIMEIERQRRVITLTIDLD